MAGVSLNAIIGDNGIITNAMDAKKKQGMAALEEFLQQKYVELYDNIKNDDNRVLSLINNPSTSKYFYKPDVGALQYIVDSEGHAFYFINKEGLPNEIKEGLVGGDAGNKTYSDYARLIDVYGVTTNLKVYYCSNGLDSLYGLAKDNLDNDNPLRIVFDSNSEMNGFLTESGFDSNGDGKISAEEAKGVKKLTINSDSGVTSLKDLYNMVSLEELTLDEVNINSLNGIENARNLFYIYLKNCTISDYSGIGRLGKSLKYLYLYNTTDTEVSKLCDTNVGIANYDLQNLEYFAVVGNETYISFKLGLETMNWDLNKSENKITTIAPFSKLSNSTKKAIKYLSLQCNEIESIDSLLDFSNITLLRLEGNRIESLHGLENMNNLTYLYANDNQLGKNEFFLETDSNNDGDDDGKNKETDSISSLYNKSKLFALQLENNKQLIWIDYIELCTSIRHLFLKGCVNFNTSSVRRISKVFFGCTVSRYRTIEDSFLSYLQSEEILNYSNLATTNTSELKTLKDMSQSDKEKVKKLDLSGSTLDNDKLNEIIGYFPNLLCLNVDNCENLTSLDFAKTTLKLEQLCFLNTGIKGNEVYKLDTYTKKLVSFRCNNPEIDITKMQNVISRCGLYNGSYSFASIGSGLQSTELIKQLENCDEITNLRISGWVNTTEEEFVLDLGKCDKLVNVTGGGMAKIGIKVGKHSLKTLRWWSHYSDSGLEIENNARIDYFWAGCLNYTSNHRDLLTKVFRLTPGDYNMNIGTLEFEVLAIDSASITDLFSIIKSYDIEKLLITDPGQYISSAFDFSQWGGKLNNLKSITIPSQSIRSLNFLENNINLEELSLTNDSITDISMISKLINLKTLNLSNNSIRFLDSLSNLKKLSSLNLTGNLIEQTATREDGTSINNLKILASLNPNNVEIAEESRGELLKLYLAQNKIIDYTDVSSLKWTDWSGFNGK